MKGGVTMRIKCCPDKPVSVTDYWRVVRGIRQYVRAYCRRRRKK